MPRLPRSVLRLALVLPTLAACAAIQRPPADPVSIAASAAPAREAERATIDTIIERLARRAVARGDRTLDVLILSGGGQNGAYGMGFLRGWKARTDAKFPTFDLVTGISTGALQAPFALLGTDAALDTAAALYRRSADRIAPTPDYLFWLRRTGGLVKTERYRASIATVLDQSFADQMRAAFREGRQAAIATTDFDLGIGRTWDLSRELGRDSAGLARVHALLIAATAIPAIFPPVVIDDHVHADGGVISNILPLLDLDGYRKLAARLKALGVSETVTVRAYVVVNLWTHDRVQVTDPASRGGMKQRSDALLFWAQQPQMVERMEILARAVSRDVPGLAMEVRHTAIPSVLAEEPGAAKLFDKEWMVRLEQLGFDRGKGATPWDAVTSPYERPRDAH